MSNNSYSTQPLIDKYEALQNAARLTRDDIKIRVTTAKQAYEDRKVRYSYDPAKWMSYFDHWQQLIGELDKAEAELRSRTRECEQARALN